MSVVLSWTISGSKKSVQFDAVVSESHSASATATSHPVEKGSDVTDHVYIDPLKLSLEAEVSNTPLRTPDTQNRGARGEFGNPRTSIRNTLTTTAALSQASRIQKHGTLTFDEEMDRPRDVYAELNDAWENRATITVDTALRQYENMVILSMTNPRETGSARKVDGSLQLDRLMFSVELQQIRVVGSKEGKVRRPKKGAPKKKKDKGNQNPKQADQLESAAHSLLN